MAQENNTTRKKKKSTPMDGMTRAARIRQVNRDAVRDKLKGIEYVRQVANDYARLEALQVPVATAKNTEDKPHAIADAIAKADCETRIIKVKMDTNFKRLAKVLPDMKQVEVTDSDGNNPLGSLASALRDAVERLG